MTEHAKASMLITCKAKHCRPASKITEDFAPGRAISYGGHIVCETCGKEWDYARQEGERAHVTYLGVRMAV